MQTIHDYDFLPVWRELVLKTPYFSLSKWLDFIGNENAQGLIYEAESDAITRKLNFKPFESEFKVMIIWLPEKMHSSCSNKLLKLIEEPPEKTVFFMVTEDEEAVITTIRSRVQTIKVPCIEREDMRKAISNLEGVNNHNIENALQVANGNFIKVLEYLDPEGDSGYFLGKFQELMRFAYMQQIPGLMEWAEDMASIGRDRQKAFFSFALRLVREFFIMNFNMPGLVYLTTEEATWGEKFSPFINERNVIPFFKEFESGIHHISINGNPRIIFLDTALRMVRLIKR